MPTVVLSLGNANAQTPPNITGATGSGDGPYTVTFASAYSAAIEAGDILQDVSAAFFRITALTDSTHMEVWNQVLVGATPANGACTTNRAFTAWSSVNLSLVDWAAAGDTILIEVHSEGSQPMSMAGAQITSTTLGASGVFRMVAASGEGHNGIPGTGARIQQSAPGNMYRLNVVDAFCPSWVMEGFEHIGVSAGSTNSSGVSLETAGTGSQSHAFRNLIVRGYTKNSTGQVWGGLSLSPTSARPIVAENCLIYDIVNTSGSANYCIGIAVGSAATAATLTNCTVHTGSGTNVVGVKDWGGLPTVKNTAVLGPATCYAGTFHTSCTHNASSDATAPDNGGGNPSYENRVTTTEWVNPGTDFMLKRTATLLDAGTVGTTTDIRGKKRTRAHDVGAYENTALEDGALLVACGADAAGEDLSCLVM